MSEAGKGRIPPKTGDAAAGSAPAKTATKHTVMLSERAEVQITGVLEVVSFDESAVLLHTSVGALLLEGAALRVHMLDVEGGRLAVSGEISGLYYSAAHGSDKRARRGIFAK